MIEILEVIVIDTIMAVVSSRSQVFRDSGILCIFKYSAIVEKHNLPHCLKVTLLSSKWNTITL